MKPTRSYTMGGLRVRDKDVEIEITIKLPKDALLTNQYFTYGGTLVTEFIMNHFAEKYNGACF